MSALDELAEFRRRYPERIVKLGGAEWRLRQTGGGPVDLMLLPGAQGTGDLFFRTSLALGDRINCISVTPPAWAEIDRLAEGLAQLLDVLGLAKVHLLGSSLSGYLAQVFALQHADRVETLFLASTFFDAGEIQASMPPPEQLARLSPEVVAAQLPLWLVPPALRNPAPNDVKTVLATMIGTEQPLATLKSRAMALALARPVPRVPLPIERIVLVDDDDDAVIPAATRAALRQRYAGARHHMLAGGGHYPAVLRDQAFAQAIEQDIKTHQETTP